MAHMPVGQRRTQLIEAALRVISRDGVARATTRAIAEEAGAPLASVHYSFAGKEDLLLAAVAHGVAHTDRLIAERAPRPGCGVRAAVAGYLELFREWALADPGALAAQYALLTWLLRTDRRAEAERSYRHYGAGLLAVLRAAATDDEADVDLDKLTRLTMAAVDGMVLQMISVGKSAVDDLPAPDVAAGLVLTARIH